MCAAFFNLAIAAEIRFTKIIIEHAKVKIVIGHTHIEMPKVKIIIGHAQKENFILKAFCRPKIIDKICFV